MEEKRNRNFPELLIRQEPMMMMVSLVVVRATNAAPDPVHAWLHGDGSLGTR